jgi:hypothetical protein
MKQQKYAMPGYGFVTARFVADWLHLHGDLSMTPV